MRKHIMFVGMDVHKKSIDITTAEDGHDGKVSHFACIDGDLKSTRRSTSLPRPERNCASSTRRGRAGS
jgi:hypothetical protein